MLKGTTEKFHVPKVELVWLKVLCLVWSAEFFSKTYEVQQSVNFTVFFLKKHTQKDYWHWSQKKKV